MYSFTFFSIIFLIMSHSSTQMPDTQNPLPECPSSPNCKRVSLILESDSSSVFSAFEEVLKEMNAEIINSDKNENRIDTVFKIPVFGYKDDLTVVIQPTEHTSNVFIRSASREGYWDIWVNSNRVNRLIRNVKNNLAN